jgi:hypothetical protein
MKLYSSSTVNRFKILRLVVIIFSSFFVFTECKSESLSPSASEKMFDKFQSISTGLCTEILKSAAAQEDGQKMLEGIEGETLQEKVEKLNAEIMKQWGNAFIVSDVEAETLLSGEYDDDKNKIEVGNCMSEFAKKRVPLPFIFRHLMQEFHTGKLSSGPLLEFTARLFKEHLKQISR